MKKSDIYTILNFAKNYLQIDLDQNKILNLEDEILKENIDIRELDFKRGKLQGLKELSTSNIIRKH